MCTSLVLNVADGNHLLGRTMDFSTDLEASPVFSPRDLLWKTDLNNQTVKNRCAFVGAGKLLKNAVFADGVNEKGLSCACLYLPGEAIYSKKIVKAKINLAPHEFVAWILGNIETIDELKQKLDHIHLVDHPLSFLNKTIPLHWILHDQTGNCYVIEPTENRLHLKENPVGVLSNSPHLEWHLNNLRNYLHLSPHCLSEVKFGDYVAQSFSQGSGAYGLPGGYTPPERFVRAAFLKQYSEIPKTEQDAVALVWKILGNVTIPKNVVLTDDNGGTDFTQYISAMCSETKTYYFSSHQFPTVYSITLDSELVISMKSLQTLELKNIYDTKKLSFSI